MSPRRSLQVGLVLLLGASGAWLWHRSHATAGQAASAPPSSARPATPVAAQPAASSSGRAPILLGKPAQQTAPQGPRWSTTAGPDTAATKAVATPKVDRATLPDGTEAQMYAGRVRYPRADMVDVHLTLQNANGEPLRGRADLEVVVVDPSGAPDHTAFKTGVIEDNYLPGVYHANVAVPATWDKVAAITTVSETGNPNAPGHLAVVQTHIDHSAPAALRDGPIGYYAHDGLELVIEVEASRKGNGVVRGELIDGSHASFGELIWQGPLEAGINRLTIPAHAIQDDGTHESQIFYVSDLTVYVDGDWSDFDANPRIVKLQPQPPPAVAGR